MFRAEIKNNTELGQKASSYIKAGLLVPDEVTIDMVLKRLAEPDCQDGYLLDGFPRSLIQADVFDTRTIETPYEICLVINLVVDKELLIGRIENRRICRECGALYNMLTHRPKVDGVCDNCGGEVYQRPDDNRTSLEKRLESYELETAPVLEHYRRLNLVRDVNASQPVDKVWEEIQHIIDACLLEQSGTEEEA